MPQLQAGKGAKASVLTRMIKPKQYLPNDDKAHRSDIILVDRFENVKGGEVYSFQYSEDDSEASLFLQACSARYVKIVV